MVKKGDFSMKKFLSLLLALTLALTCLTFVGCSIPDDPDEAVENLKDNGYTVSVITNADEIQDMIYFIPGIPEGKISTIITGISGTSSITIFYCEDKSTAETIEEALDEIDDVYGLQGMELGRKAKRVWFGHEAAIDAAK
jgi:hypothetical protein